MSMTYGKEIKITLFGSSHSAEVGVTISGLPSGISIDVQLLQEFVYRRSARGNIGSTPRHENDLIEFVSGLEKGVTTGYEIKAIIKNTDIVSSDYDKFDELPRPSHADYVAHIKYGKAMEGGGIFSGRMTAPLCVAGGIALQVLKQKGIDIFAYISELGSVQAESYLINLSESPKMPIYDTLPLLNTEYRAKMIAEIKTAQVEGDSLGGVVECVGLNFPVGVGEPFFRSLESAISSALFSVPAVKGIDFGRGFGFGNSRGSEVNDGFVIVDGKIKTKTNNNGGINGGLSNGMPLLLRVAIKPTSSITIEQDTVNLKTKENAKIKIEGRHDVTIVPRAVPCIESAVALAVLDLMREGGFICAENNINCIRTEIDKVDDELAELLVKRQKLSSKIGILKSEKDINIVDDVRENEIIKRVATKSTGIALDDVKKIYNTIFEMSHQCQKKIAARERCEKVFLIGKPLEHSQSPEIHKQLGKYEYLLKEIDEEDVSKFLDDRQFDALNVTVPYKNYVANLMNELDDVAKRIGAVNVVKCVGDKLIGYNTDYFGFKYLLESENVSVENKKIVVLGSHGTSVTIKCVTEDLGAKEVILVPRVDLPNIAQNQDILDADILVNATPVGMFPNIDEKPVDIKIFSKLELVIDVIYNPYRTRLLLDARAKNIKTINGLKMLIAQAKASAEIFMKSTMPNTVIDDIYKKMYKESRNVVLIGMGGSGKSTIAEALGNALHLNVLDTDTLIEKKTGKTILQIFDEYMEEGFRKYEKEVIFEVAKSHNSIVATGGGSVIDDENCRRLRHNGILVYVKCNPDQLEIQNRPCYPTKEAAKRVFAKRSKTYELNADIVVENQIFKKSMEEIIKEIQNGLADYKWR